MEPLIKALKAAGEPTRLRILAALSQFELTVTELVYLLGQSQPRISRHLKLLVEAGLLERHQEGSWVFHRISDTPDADSIAQRLIHLIDYQDPALVKDKAKLEAIKQLNAQSAADYFKEQAGDWDQIRQLVGSDEAIEQAMLSAANSTSISSMVDLGTGTGRILEIFAPRVDKGIGYDTSPAMLKVARAKLEQSNISHCQVRQSDIRDLPTDSASVDLVTVHQVLHYLDNPIAVIQESQRILKPGGQLLIVDFAKHQHEFLRTEHAHRRLGFSQSEVQFWCDSSTFELSKQQTLTQNSKRQGLDVMMWALRKTGMAKAMQDN